MHLKHVLNKRPIYTILQGNIFFKPVHFMHLKHVLNERPIYIILQGSISLTLCTFNNAFSTEKMQHKRSW